MNSFKIKIAVTLSSIIVIIITTLVLLEYNAFRAESVFLNKEILHERNRSVEISITDKIDSYKNALASIKMAPTEAGDKALSKNGTIQIQTVYRNLQHVSEGAYIFRRDGTIYRPDGKLFDFNVKELQRSYWKALFEDGKQFFISEPFKSARSGKEILFIAYKLDNNTASGLSIYLDAVLGGIADRKDMFLYAHDGTIIFSAYPEYLGKNIKNIRPHYSSFNETHPELEYKAMVDGEDMRFSAFWNKIDITGWEYAVFVKTKTIEEGANKQLL